MRAKGPVSPSLNTHLEYNLLHACTSALRPPVRCLKHALSALPTRGENGRKGGCHDFGPAHPHSASDLLSVLN